MAETSKLELRGRYMKRLAALKNERSTWIEHWRDLNDNIRPRRFRWLYTERNKGWKRNSAIINSTATTALRTLAAGMMAGITPRSRPWFRLTTPDPELSKFGPVRAYLDLVQERMFQVFARSNIYNVFHGTYEQLGLFGTAIFLLEADDHSVLRAYPWPIGQYCLANSARLDIDTGYRELSMTVGQLVEQFGKEACTREVQEKYEKGDYDVWIEVVRVVEPNRDYEAGKLGPKGQRYKSCWFEKGREAEDRFLLESGFRVKPFCAPRWVVTAEDVYGESPGMDALGDVRSVQLLERRKAQVADKISNPPMKGPMALMNQRIGLGPGEMTYVDQVTPGQAFSPAYEVPPAALQALRESIGEDSQRVKTTFYEDVWMMIAQGQQDPRKTATEVAALKEEKMMQLGPVMERLDDEMLDPVIDRAYDILFHKGLLPPAPKEMKGKSFAVEYISIVAQALKMIQGVAPKERLASFVGSLIGSRPEVADNVNWDLMVEDYADDLGVKSTLIIPEDQVQAIRADRAKQQAQQQQMQQTLAGVQAAQTLSKTDTGGDNALGRILASVPGAASGGLPQ